MSKELVLAAGNVDVAIPGVVSGCRVFFSSENHVAVTPGRFVTPDGGFAEVRRTVKDAALLPNRDIVLLTGRVIGQGCAFYIRDNDRVGRDETVIATIKILRYPVRSREDIYVSHALRSSNSAMSKLITLAATGDNATTEFNIPWRVPMDHHSDVYVDGVLQEEFEDYRLIPIKDEYDRRYTVIVFTDAPHEGASIQLQSGLKDL